MMKDKNIIKCWFSKRRFGLFLHFGLYAIEGWHEQDQMRRRIPRAEYSKLASRFNPREFNADAILDRAESVGMEYVCLTTKHHDGFCLWDTKETEYNVMQTPYGSDIVAKLADACHARNFPLGLYYSVVDWHHPNYPNQGRHHELEGPEEGDSPDWEKYMDFLRAQVRELCTKYGEIRHFFWDMNVPEFQDPSVNDMIRSLQPNIVINDRGFDDGDFGTPEREYNTNETGRMVRFTRPTEACNSVGTQSWGYRLDEDYYNTSFLLQSIDSMMSKGANYLLNVGPDATGAIPKQASEILSNIGVWYTKVREGFSDTEPCTELTTNSKVLLTRRDNTLYVHLEFPATSDSILLPPISEMPTNAILLNTGEKLACSTDQLPMYWKKQKTVLRVKLPKKALELLEPLVIKLEFSSELSSEVQEVIEFKG